MDIWKRIGAICQLWINFFSLDKWCNEMGYGMLCVLCVCFIFLLLLNLVFFFFFFANSGGGHTNYYAHNIECVYSIALIRFPLIRTRPSNIIFFSAVCLLCSSPYRLRTQES